MKTLAGLAFALALAASTMLPGAAEAGGNWNDANISWKGYEEGLAAAKADGKPVLLLFYTDSCPHCTAYSGVFHDGRVVEKAKAFVMIRVDKDANPALSARYAPDGEYVPRTLFLSSTGELQSDIHAQRTTTVYYYNEINPESVMRGMDAALARFSKKQS